MRTTTVILSAICCTLLLLGSVYAGGHPNTGCGLGHMAFPNQSTILEQVLAATTNGTSGNQTFGISSGTSNCDRPSEWASNERLNRFVAENMDNLAGDIAKGQGEYLSTLAVLMEIPENSRTTFYAKLQDNFSRIYTSEAVSHVDVINNIQSVTTAG